MTTERWATLAERAVVALVLFIHALLILAGPWIDGWPQLLQAFLPFCQLTLLLAFLFLVPLRNWVERLALAAALVAAPAAWYWMWHDRSRFANELEVPMLVGCGLLLSLLFGSGRLCGWRLVSAEAATGGRDRAWQFSIRSLMVLTTVVAASVAVLEGVRPLLQPGLPDKAHWSFAARWVYDTLEEIARPPMMRIYVLSAAIAGISAGCIWAVHGRRAVRLRLLIVALCAAAVGMYVAQLIHGRLLFGVAIALLQYAALLAGTLLPLRLWNMRLTRSVHKAATLGRGAAPFFPTNNWETSPIARTTGRGLDALPAETTS